MSRVFQKKRKILYLAIVKRNNNKNGGHKHLNSNKKNKTNKLNMEKIKKYQRKNDNKMAKIMGNKNKTNKYKPPIDFLRALLIEI